ncbi:MAG: tetratricopeptide repeat protein [Acidobacteriales bacterium]|nr:tetratricopeptide repeat protein [Terriglobales bacterium]
MKASARVLALGTVGVAVLLASGCNKLRARDQLNKGVAAYKNTKYEEAIDHFQQAVNLDPNLMNGRLYLATALANQYIPGADNEDNNRVGQQAIDEFKRVLAMHPGREQKITSLKGIASLYFNMKKLDQAKEYNRQVAAADPNDPDAHYSVGVIDWTESYQPRMEARAKLGLKPEEPLNAKDKEQKSVCVSLREKNFPVITEGIDELNNALRIRPDYDDAMAYLNLLYREKADLECDDPAARAGDLKTADGWVDKTLATKKAKAEKQSSATGITLDQPKQ